MDELTWNYDEFLCFLLIYVSNIDVDFSENEIERLHAQFSLETFEKMNEEFESRTDYQALEEILKYRGVYYPTAEQKQELLDRVKDQFFADGEYTVMERELYHFFERLL